MLYGQQNIKKKKKAQCNQSMGMAVVRQDIEMYAGMQMEARDRFDHVSVRIPSKQKLIVV